MPQHTEGSSIAINMFRMREGVSPTRFAEFSAEIDQPTCLAHRDVVRRFDAYRVLRPLEGEPGADIVEVMEVSDWQEWVRVRDHDPSMTAVMTGFDELVEARSVRSALVVPILRSK